MSTTLQNVIDRITLDYLNRTDLDAVAVRAVQAAIRFYERQRFPWNETTLTLTASVGVATLSVPSDFLVLDRLEVQFQSGTYGMVEQSFEFVRNMNQVPGGNSLPEVYNHRGYTFEVAPVPDSAYLVNCHYLKRLTELTSTNMGASNKWLSAAEDAIVYHATRLIWSNVLRNTEEAAKYTQLTNEAMAELYRFLDQTTTTRIRSTRF